MAAVRADTERVCQLLINPTPQQLDRCADLLAGAVAQLAACRDDVRLIPESRDDEARAEARRLQRSIHCAQRLLSDAAAFHSGWIRYLGSLCAGYTPHGEPATVPRGSRLCARG